MGVSVRLLEDRAEMSRGRRSSRCSEQEFIEAVQQSVSIREVLRRLSLTPAGANYKFVHAWIARLSLDSSHLLGQAYLRGKSHSWTLRIPLDAILIENSAYQSTSRLKSRLLREGILKYECYDCGLTEWRGGRLALVLDHINGVNTDQRRENLRLLCPNCHSQTPTFAGRNKGKRTAAG